MPLNDEALRKVKGNPSAETAPGRRIKLDLTREEYPYDMPRELIEVILAKFPLESWVKVEDESDEVFLTRQGQEFMNFLMEQADSNTYRDRTAEMIELVAKQTGVSFPHRFERYVELAILSLRPRDAWTVTEATTRALKIRSFNCSLQKQLGQRGINDCKNFCLASSAVIAGKIGESLEMRQTNEPEADGFCELTFRKEQR
ncbi:MAG: hypothetical protein ACYCVD_04435 [Desulfitobacteriaceae bacterium]